MGRRKVIKAREEEKSRKGGSWGVGGVGDTYAQKSHRRFSHLLIGEKEKSPLPSPPLKVHRKRCNRSLLIRKPQQLLRRFKEKLEANTSLELIRKCEHLQMILGMKFPQVKHRLNSILAYIPFDRESPLKIIHYSATKLNLCLRNHSGPILSLQEEAAFAPLWNETTAPPVWIRNQRVLTTSSGLWM